MDAAEQLAKMLKRQPSNNTNKSENSESPTRNGSFEVLINLKILADETGKQMWAENCLMEHKGTIRELVMEAKEKFVPNDFKKGTTLKLRNVTTYSTRYNLEVSVDIDGKAMDGGKYIANFIVDLESQEQAESSSMKSAKENDKSAKTITAEFLEKQTLLEELDNDLIAIRTQLDEANKMNKTMQIERDNNEKLLKSQQNELKKTQSQLDEIKKEIEAKKTEKTTQLDEIKKEIEAKKTEKKTLNERIDKKNKELDSVRKHLKEKDKKLETYKKDLANGVEELDKMIKKKENALKECEELQSQKEEYARSLEDLRNDELLCRSRIDEMQQEEKQFQIMLKEMREQTLLQRIAEAEQREQQQEREQFTLVNDPVETTSANNSTPRKEHPKAFTQRCMYYERGSCWRGDKCTFIHEESRHRRMRRPTPQQHDEFYYGRQQREEQAANGIEPVIKREERRSEEEIGMGIGGRVGTAVHQEGGMPPKKMPIQIENIEGLILANEQQQLNQRLAQGLGQEIVVDHENVEVLENDNAENAGNWLMVNEDAFSQAPFQQQMQQRNWNAQQEHSIRTNQFFNSQPQNYNDISEQQYTINNNNNMNNNNRGRTVYRNDLYGAHKFQQQKQGQKRGGSKMRADKNAGKRGRYRPRSRSNGNTSRRFSTSPIRNAGHMPSTSSAPYGNHQTIMDRITIDEPLARGPPNSHSIHARLTFEQ